MALTAMNMAVSDATARPVPVEPPTVTVQLLACSSEQQYVPECTTQAKVRNNIANLIFPDDYPGRPQREGRGGVVYFRLLADVEKPPSGDPPKYPPGDCEIVGSSGHDDLDKETCRLLKRRVRFESGSVDAARSGVDGRVIWIPGWWLDESLPPSEPIIQKTFLLGEASDTPRCWVDAVRREGAGFRIYLKENHPAPDMGTSGKIEVVKDTSSASISGGGSFFLAPDSEVVMSNNPHDSCSMRIVGKDGRLTVEQQSIFGEH